MEEIKKKSLTKKDISKKYHEAFGHVLFQNSYTHAQMKIKEMDRGCDLKYKDKKYK